LRWFYHAALFAASEYGRRFRAQVNNDGGAVPIWELTDSQTENVETHQNQQ
jgi:hypothetical protein